MEPHAKLDFRIKHADLKKKNVDAPEFVQIVEFRGEYCISDVPDLFFAAGFR